MNAIPVTLPADSPATVLRERAIGLGHEMSGWQREDDDCWLVIESTCACCDYYVYANEDGAVIVTAGLQLEPPYAVATCPNPLPVDGQLRLLGASELFPALRG